jgi:hypothetical protein
MEDNKDKRIDIPSEANREKHINFLEAEERTDSSDDSKRFGHSEDDEKRRDAWQKGIAEGEKARKGED